MSESLRFPALQLVTPGPILDRLIDGIHYLNDGDWVESCTALVEHRDGRFEILNWNNPRIAQSTEETHAHTDRDRRLVPAG